MRPAVEERAWSLADICSEISQVRSMIGERVPSRRESSSVQMQAVARALLVAGPCVAACVLAVSLQGQLDGPSIGAPWVLITALVVVIALAVAYAVRPFLRELRRLAAEHPSPLPESFDSLELAQVAARIHHQDVAESKALQAAQAHATDLAAQVKELSGQIESVRVEADTSRRARDVFLANMSHEVRTPMTAILGYLSMLGDPDVLPEHRETLLRKVRSSGDHLLGLINDLLDLSQIESGALAVNSKEMSPVEVFQQTIELARPRAIAKGLDLAVEFVFPLPQTIHLDPLRLRQIILNLLAYGIGDTESGGVRASMSYSCEPGSPGQLLIQIADTGFGIDDSELREIFSPLSRANCVARQDTGLGLAIARRLAELMDASISASSARGVGTTFTLVIPISSPETTQLVHSPEKHGRREAASESISLSPLEGMRVLYCEDGIDNQRIVAFALRKAGAEVELVDNGRIGIETFLRASDNGDPFDLILMDMQMPEMDGYAATRELRKLGVRIPIIALTAHAMVSDREKCMVAGCDDYAAKPIERQALVALCSRWCSPEFVRSVEPGDAAKAA